MALSSDSPEVDHDSWQKGSTGRFWSPPAIKPKVSSDFSTDVLATMRQDGTLVGTAALFESDNVYAPPAAHKEIPTPSIYSDGRGQIMNCLVGSKRINLLHTKAGVMRSGDIHKNTQKDFVFSGKVEVWLLQRDGSTTKMTYTADQFIIVPPGVPHIFNFVEDTVIAEWWGSGSEAFSAWFYRPYRALVDASFGGSAGELQLLGPANRGGSLWHTALLCGTVGVLGAVVGFGLGRRR